MEKSSISPTAQQMRSAAPRAPLDYSFMSLTSLSDMARLDPVSGKKWTSQIYSLTTLPNSNATIDSLPLNMSSTTVTKSEKSARPPGSANSQAREIDLENDVIREPEHSSTATKTKQKSPPVSLRVNNNNIQVIDDLNVALQSVFEDPSALQWLDLSNNQLSVIPPTVFMPYSRLFTLHLHGNNISRYSDIDNLANCLPNLHALTLHGNPLEEKKQYRSYVIASFSCLTQLNFSSITRRDRELANAWASIRKKAFKKGSIIAKRQGVQLEDDII